MDTRNPHSWPVPLRPSGQCSIHYMGELTVDPSVLLYSAEQAHAWHEDCATTFADAIRAINESINDGWAASSKESMLALSSRWQIRHHALLSQVLDHARGFSTAAMTYQRTDEDSGQAIRQLPPKATVLNL